MNIYHNAASYFLHYIDGFFSILFDCILHPLQEKYSSMNIPEKILYIIFFCLLPDLLVILLLLILLINCLHMGYDCVSSFVKEKTRKKAAPNSTIYDFPQYMFDILVANYDLLQIYKPTSLSKICFYPNNYAVTDSGESYYEFFVNPLATCCLSMDIFRDILNTEFILHFQDKPFSTYKQDCPLAYCYEVTPHPCIYNHLSIKVININSEANYQWYLKLVNKGTSTRSVNPELFEEI